MSSLLEEAFVEANTLKEAAKQQAQQELAEKYAQELDHKITKILEEQNLQAVFEQDEEEDPLGDLGGEEDMDLGFEDDLEDPMADGEGAEDPVDSQIPYAFTDGERMCPCEEEEEEVEFTFDLGQLIDDEEESHEEAAEDVMGGEEDIMGAVEEVPEEEEELPLKEDLLASLFEEDYLEGLAEMLDLGDSKNTPALETSRLGKDATLDELGDVASEKQKDHSIDAFLDTLVKEEEEPSAPLDNGPHDKIKKDLEESKKANKKLKNRIRLLESKNEKLTEYNEAFSNKLQEAADALRSLSLENSKLSYQNRVMENASLNERQKSKLVEAIAHAKSETEAESIYRLQENFVASASANNRQRSENPLNEALNNRPSPAMLNLRRREPLISESKDQDRELERQRQVWKKLAGIEN